MKPEDRVRSLLHELADSTPVNPDLDVVRARRSSRADTEPDYLVDPSPIAPLAHGRWLVAAVAAVVLGVLIAAIAVWSGQERALVRVSDSELDVNTAALDGGRLAFVLENNLYVADGADGTVRRLTNVGSGNEVSHVSLSADGDWVAFSIHDVGGWWIASVDGSTVHHLDATNTPRSAAWSPTAPELAFAIQNEVRIAAVDGTVQTVRGMAPTAFTTVVWSPDGRELAYASDQHLPVIVGLDTAHIGRVSRIPIVTMVGWGAQGPLGFEEFAREDRGVIWSVAFGYRELVVGGPLQWLDPQTYASVSNDGSVIATVGPLPQIATLVDRSNRLLIAGTCEDPATSATGTRVAAFCLRGQGSGLFVLTTDEEPRLLVDGLRRRGTIDGELDSRGLVAEPPEWMHAADALIARLDESQIARIDAQSGEQTRIVEGDRFLEPSDDYPGGVGFAYWHPDR